MRTAIIMLLVFFTGNACHIAAQDYPKLQRIMVRMAKDYTPSFAAQGAMLLSPGLEDLLRHDGFDIQPMLPLTTLNKGVNELARIVYIDVPENADIDHLLAALNERFEVEYAVPDRYIRLHEVPNDSAWASQWGAHRVAASSAWDVTTGDPDVIIGVIDTGIDFDHPDLRGQLWINPAEDLNGDGLFQPWPSTELRNGIPGDLDGLDNDGNGFVDDVIGYDFVDQQDISNAAGGDYRDPDPIPEDEMGHGTNVSGIIAATADNGIGIAGIAPGCRIMTLRAFDARGFGAESDVSRALAYAVANGAKVINMSFGDVVYTRVLRDVIRYAYARGVVMVASAGNSQSSALHYPSAYDETISVSATTREDKLAGYSNYGATIDLAAPGSDIVTTDRGGTYSSFYGTSAAAPFVSAAAALLLSRNKNLSPEEVRGILVASAEDLGATGWDDYYGAGLLRIDRAVRSDYPSVLRITSPRTDAASSEETVVVIGTATSPLMTGYKMQYGVGVNAQRWIDITGVISKQIVDDTLCIWDVSALPDTTYTLRLSALSNKNITLDDRVVVHIRRSPPQILEALLMPTLDGDSYGVSVGFITDEPTLGKVWYRLRASTDQWTWVSAEGDTQNNLVIEKTHSIFLGAPLFMPGKTYEFYLSAENAVGLEAILKEQNGKNLEITIPPPVSGFGFNRVFPALPLSRIFEKATDLNGNGVPEVLLNDLTDDGRLKAWEYNGSRFEPVPGVELQNEIPRGVGDVTGDGRPELLTSIVRNGFLNSGPPGVFPSQRIWGDSVGGRFWPIDILDVTGDGVNEVLAIVNDTTIGVFRWNGSTLEQFAAIVNPTGAPPEGNQFSAPRVAVGDFNGNGKTDLLFGDADGDFFIAEYNGAGAFPIIWASSNDFVNASDFVVAGDFTGDGRTEFAAGFRTEADDVVPFWFVGIFRLDSENKTEALWSAQFHGVTESSQYGSFTRIQNSLTAGNLDNDPADELVITVYPYMYIIDYDAITKNFEAIFYLPLVNTNAAIIADMDGDGVNELGIAMVDSVVWYRKNLPYTGPEPPRSLSVHYVNDHSVRLEWTIGTTAPEYRVYKGSDIASMELFGTFPAPLSLLDPALTSGQSVVYAVSAFDHAATPKESPRCYSRILNPHPAPVVDSAVYAQQGQILLYVSQDMGNQLPSPSVFKLNGIREPSSIALLKPRTLLLSFDTLSDGEYGIHITGLRDGEGIPFANAVIGPIHVVSPVINACYIEMVEFLPPKSFRVLFSAPVEAISASVASNYSFEPGGTALSAIPDSDNPHVVVITVSGEIPIGALGKEYVLSVRNVRCLSGATIGDGPGATAGVILNRQNLDEAFVYPNPLRPEDGQQFVTFANLTPRAVIRVYTVSGMFVREIVEDDGNGGVEWDLRNRDGNLVPAGVYLFRATGTDSNGNAVEVKLGKFAIIR